MKNTVLTISCIFLTTSLLFAQSITKSSKLTEESVIALNETASSDRLPICLPPGCRCEGGMTEMQLYYLGTSNVNIEVFRDEIYTNLITTIPNVTTGDLITVSALTSSSGQFAYYTYFRVTDLTTGEACSNRIYTQCPRNVWPGSLSDLQILGKRYGDLFVYGYTSSAENQQCDIGDIEQYWKVGGNIVAPDNMTFGTLNNEAVSIITNNQERGIITNEGNFGFGTNAPVLKLDVNVTASDNPNNGNGIRVTTNTSDAGLRLENNNGGQNYYIHSTGTGSTNRAGNLAFGRLGQLADMILTNEGRVAIGTTATPLSFGDYKLFVQGGILTEEVRVRTGWADHVFNTNYNLLPLYKVEKYIQENGHLPDMPSAKEIEDKGLELKSSALDQQIKIEEIYLHLIEMDKEVKALKAENAQLKARLEQLEKK